MTPEVIDEFARDFPSLTMHGPIPPATTHALAARVVELLGRVEESEAQVQSKTQEFIAANNRASLSGTALSISEARVEELELHLRRAVEAGTNHDGSRSSYERLELMLDTLDKDGW